MMGETDGIHGARCSVKSSYICCYGDMDCFQPGAAIIERTGAMEYFGRSSLESDGMNSGFAGIAVNMLGCLRERQLG